MKVINFENPRTGRVIPQSKRPGKEVLWHFEDREDDDEYDYLSPAELMRTFIFEGMPTKVYELI